MRNKYQKVAKLDMNERKWESEFAVKIAGMGHQYVQQKDEGKRQFQSVPYDGILIFKPENIAVFIEIKIGNEPMKEHQIKFAQDCLELNSFHYTIRVFDYWLVAFPYNCNSGKLIANTVQKLIDKIKVEIV